MPASDFFGQAVEMTIPAEDVPSIWDGLIAFVDELRELPHVENLKEITALRKILDEQKKQNLLRVQEDLGLHRLQNAVQNAGRVAAKWKLARVRLLFEPWTFEEELRNTFMDLRKSLNQLQGFSRDQIVDQLDKILVHRNREDSSDDLKNSHAKFKKKFFEFLREKRSKSDPSEDAISVGTWLGRELRTDAGSIKQELKELEKNESSLLEMMLVYVYELEERRSTSDEGEPSVADAEERGFDESLSDVAHRAVELLGTTRMHRVLSGLEDLIRCTKLPNGKLAVFEANAIPRAIELAQAEEYINNAMKLLEALTASPGGVEDQKSFIVNRKIILDVGDHLDFLIDLMKDESHSNARLLAAETVVNMLVNRQVWEMVRTKYDIVSALVAISNEDMVDQAYRERADRVCLDGLKHLTSFSEKRRKPEKLAGDKSQIIFTALMKLLSDGLEDAVLKNLAEDTLVVLDEQILVMDRSDPPQEICLDFREDLLDRMATDNLISHTTVRGRKAIINMMTRLCKLDSDGITEDLFLFLLKIMRTTRDEIVKHSGLGENHPKMKEMKELLGLSVMLLCFCVTHGEDTFQTVLTKNVAERKTLKDMLEEQNSGILDEAKLKILEIFDHIDIQSSDSPIPVLVKMAKSPSSACRAQVTSFLLNFVIEHLDANEIWTQFEEERGVAALMDLLHDEEGECRRDALLALYKSSSKITIQMNELPLQIILTFLQPSWPIDVREAAAGFLDLMIIHGAANGIMLMETIEPLRAALLCVDKDADNPDNPDNPVSQKCASALLHMATEEDESVLFGIARNGLSALVKYVQNRGSIDHRELLTSMLERLCRSGSGFEEEVTSANGHTFLVRSLQDYIKKEAAALGLLNLVRHVKTRHDVVEAGFVEVAMESIDQESASAEIALGLASVCSTSDGLDKIVACSGSVGALLTLLQHCPRLDGKGAAATVIAQLYPRLCSEDQRRSDELTGACFHLVRYIDRQEYASQLPEFLKALAAFATGKKGKQAIYEERGQTSLIKFLRNRDIDPQVRDLVLQTLAEMSNVFEEEDIRDSTYRKILSVFIEHKIGILLRDLPKNARFREGANGMKNLLTLIRNLARTGPPACSHLSESNAVQMLLEVLSDQGEVLSPLTELAVRALVKLVDDPNGKKAFLNVDGIKLLVSILKRDETSSVVSVTTVILASVAQDPETGKKACDSIFACKILQKLNTLMLYGETTRIKWQAAVLTRLLATNSGSVQKVCTAMAVEGTLDALRDLRDQRHCGEIADDILRFARAKNGACRRYMEDWQDRVR